MNNRRVARIIALVLALLMAFSVIWVAIDALTASAYVTQAEIDKLKEEKREYERRKQEIQSEINTIEFEKKTEVAKKSVLDDRIVLTGMEIENIYSTIDFYILLIHEKELEVEAARERENEQLNKFKTRVRDMEENGIITYLEIIFDSSSFADLLARLDFVGDIMQADERTYGNLIIARDETEAAVADLEATKLELEFERELLEEKYEELAEQREQANELIKQIEATLETYIVLYEEEAAEADRVQREINKKEEELRQQEARAAAAARAKGTGQLMWPVPSSGYITSKYGIRLHPVWRVYRQHTGIDIHAEYGENIVASDTGTVITSEYNSGYGHYIVISHGNGWTTLYAHMSTRVAGVGETVSKGQIIGYIGSTGVSTGPHLHFEVSINGSRVDPEEYL